MDVELNETLSNFHQNNCNGLTIEKKASQGHPDVRFLWIFKNEFFYSIL